MIFTKKKLNKTLYWMNETFTANEKKVNLKWLKWFSDIKKYFKMKIFPKSDSDLLVVVN